MTRSKYAINAANLKTHEAALGDASVAQERDILRCQPWCDKEASLPATSIRR